MLKFIDFVSKGLISVEILRLDALRVDVVAAVTAVVMAPVMAARNAVMSAAGSVGLSLSLLSPVALFFFEAARVLVKSETILQPLYSTKLKNGYDKL